MRIDPGCKLTISHINTKYHGVEVHKLKTGCCRGNSRTAGYITLGLTCGHQKERQYQNEEQSVAHGGTLFDSSKSKVKYPLIGRLRHGSYFFKYSNYFLEWVAYPIYTLKLHQRSRHPPRCLAMCVWPRKASQRSSISILVWF